MPSTGFIPFKPAPVPAPQPKIGGGGGAVAPIVGPGGQKPTGGSLSASSDSAIYAIYNSKIYLSNTDTQKEYGANESSSLFLFHI